MSDEKEERQIVNSEIQEKIEIQSSEAKKKPESQGFDRIAAEQATEVYKGAKIVEKQEEADGQTLIINEANEEEVQEFQKGQAFIDEKLENNVREYNEEIEKLQKDIPYVEDKDTEEKNPKKILDEASTEIDFLDMSTFSNEEKLKTISKQLDLLKPLTNNTKDYDNYSKARELEFQLLDMKKRLEVKMGTKGREKKEIVSDSQKEKLPEDLLKNAQDRFSDSLEDFRLAYDGATSDKKNPTIPNYLNRRVKELEEIIDNIKKDGTVDNESIQFLQEAAKKDIDDMINSMVGELSITELYSNKYNKSDIIKEEISPKDLEKYVEIIKNKTVKLREIGERWLKIDETITNATRDMDTGLFSMEHKKAHEFFEKALNPKNTAEQKAYLTIISHILDNIEKGLKDEKMKKALQRT